MYNILIVDDSILNRTLIKNTLTEKLEDLNFYEASDGVEALELVSSVAVDLIFLDLMMPRKDGYLVLEEIKKNSSYLDIPVIVNSSITDIASIKKTLELGAIDYFIKPITPEQIDIVIPLKTSNALKYYEQKRQLQSINERIQTEINIAGSMQRTLMNTVNNNKFKSVDAFSYYSSSNQLGGNLIEVIEKDNELWFIIADINGVGTAAAMVSFAVKALFNHTITQYHTPSEVMNEINKSFCSTMGDLSSINFSAILGVIKNNQLVFVNAGHPYPFVLKNDKEKSEALVTSGQLVGVMDDATYEEKTIDFNHQDCLFLYTDGIFTTNKTSKIMATDTLFNSIRTLYSSESHLSTFIDEVTHFFLSSTTKKELNESDATILTIRCK